ncbi:MAG: CARDB domain-containing protein [Halioglobus sp.]
MKYFSRGACIVLLALCAQGTSAYNYVTRTCGTVTGYNDGHMTFNFTNNLTAAQKTDMSTAFSRLTYFSDTSITANDNGDSNFGTGNGQNEIYHDTTHPTAQCWLDYNTSTCVVEEVDMRFGNQTWVTGEDSQHLPYLSAANGGGRAILATAIHEGGHCIGMGHENTVYNMMGDERDHVTRNGTITYYGPGENLSDGLIDRYGKRSATDTYRDVGVTIMRYDTVSGEYSSHKFGVLRNTSGVTLPVVGSYEGQDVYEVVAGEQVRMELTIENNGEKNTESFHMGFYLSTNSIISTGDTLLGTDNGYIQSRNAPYEVNETVTIPIGTAPGNYYLGAYVDHDFLIPEVTSANNIAYYPVTVLPPRPDLTVPFAGVNDTTLVPGQSFSALAIVRNDGAGPANATTLRYYRSTNSVINSSDTLIGTDAISALAAGSQQATNDPDTAPLIQGTWWIGACVDSVAGESVTSNNCSTGAQITVAYPPPEVTTEPVTDIQVTQATLHATAVGYGSATTLYFDWGTDNLFQNTKTYGSFCCGSSPSDFQTVLSGLVCNTTYQVRARVVSGGGADVGVVREFTTPVCGGCGG